MANTNTQRFEGELNTYAPGASLEAPLLQTTVKSGDEISIPAELPSGKSFGSIANQPIVAVMELGGAQNGEASYQPTKVDVVRIDDPENPDILLLNQRQRLDTRRAEDYMLAAYGSGGRLEAVAFVKNLQHYVIVGREGNLEWIRIGKPTEPILDTPEDWTPFEDNPSVSREQFVISCEDKRLVIRGLSERSRTNLKTYATEQHKEVIARGQSDERQAEKTGRGLLGLFRRH